MKVCPSLLVLPCLLLVGIHGSVSTAADDRVTLFPVKEDVFAGYVQTNATTDANMFYLFFGAREEAAAPADTPLTIWLNGGPGASSLFGCFAENGPVMLDETNTPIERELSWNARSHMLFIDNPVGTGYSYVTDETHGYVTDEQQLGEQFYRLLQGFFDRHPTLRANPLYISGESYAGKYIPYVTTTILDKNLVVQNVPLNIKGIAIGDGWMDPIIQHKAAIDFGFANGLIDTRQLEAVSAMYAECFRTLEEGDYIKANKVCGVGGGGDGQDGIMGYILDAAGNPDVYDIREFSDGLGPLTVNLTKYLNTPAVRTALHVGNHSWAISDGESIVAEKLEGDLQRPNTHLLPRLVDELRVLIYTGTFDLSCGYIGTERILQAMRWPGQDLWPIAKRSVWRDPVTNATSGYWKKVDHLVQVTIPLAGHLVPLNQPAASLEMINMFLFDQF